MRITLALLLLGACTYHSSQNEMPDALGDAMVCTGAVYDSCTANEQCKSMTCHNYTMFGMQVCTTTCTPGDDSTCPVDSTGQHGMCNAMGNCRPAVANSCTP